MGHTSHIRAPHDTTVSAQHTISAQHTVSSTRSLHHSLAISGRISTRAAEVHTYHSRSLTATALTPRTHTLLGDTRRTCSHTTLAVDTPAVGHHRTTLSASPHLHGPCSSPTHDAAVHVPCSPRSHAAASPITHPPIHSPPRISHTHTLHTFGCAASRSSGFACRLSHRPACRVAHEG